MRYNENTGLINMSTYHLNVCIIANADLSKRAGDTGRIMAFASELKKSGMEVTLIVPKPTKSELMIPSHGINLVYLPIKHCWGSIISVFRRTRAQIKKAKKLRKENTIFLIETSSLGGYFAIRGFSGYILDIHGIVFDEVGYVSLPWYIPKNIYQRYMYFLEKIAVRRAEKIIVVSKQMAEFIANKWEIPEDKITIIPNGYFTLPVANIVEKGVKESRGMVTFVGLLTKWANIDKIIRVAALLKNEKATFYIVGDGPPIYRQELEELVHSYGLTNVVFTGSVPLDEAYEMIARSEVALLPFPKALCTVVACPIKILEYMALGKAMVLDEGCDLSLFLKEKDAALVCDQDKDMEFAESILMLLKNAELRRRIGANAKRLAGDFSWEKQGQKLTQVVEEVGNLKEMKKVEVGKVQI